MYTIYEHVGESLKIGDEVVRLISNYYGEEPYAKEIITVVDKKVVNITNNISDAIITEIVFYFDDGSERPFYLF